MQLALTPDEAAFRDQLHALVDQIGDYDIVAL
jgi:hypothetical protein